MRRIYKYLANEDHDIEFRGEILYVGRQNGQIFIWAFHDDEAPVDKRRIYVVPTGGRLADWMGDPDLAPYIGTVQDSTSPFVWHLFAQKVS